MKTRSQLRNDIRRILGYELLASDFDDTLINTKIQDAYSIVAKMSGLPIEFVERTYTPTQASRWSNNKIYNTTTLNLHGLWHIYRIWWKNQTQDWYELKPAIYEEPEQDKVFQGTQRIIPSPLDENRLTYPRIKLLSERAGQNTTQLPTSFIFTDNKLIFDNHPTSGNCQIRIIGSFIPHPDPNSPIPQLNSDTSQTPFDEMLDYALLYYATALLLDPYPDLIPLSQELIRKAIDYANTSRSLNMMSLLQYSPGGILETTQGVQPPTEPEPKRRSNSGNR